MPFHPWRLGAQPVYLLKEPGGAAGHLGFQMAPSRVVRAPAREFKVWMVAFIALYA